MGVEVLFQTWVRISTFEWKRVESLVNIWDPKATPNAFTAVSFQCTKDIAAVYQKSEQSQGNVAPCRWLKAVTILWSCIWESSAKETHRWSTKIPYFGGPLSSSNAPSRVLCPAIVKIQTQTWTTTTRADSVAERSAHMGLVYAAYLVPYAKKKKNWEKLMPEVL